MGITYSILKKIKNKLTSKQKQFLKDKLPIGLQNFLRSFSESELKQSEKYISNLRLKLYELGFRDKVLEELTSISLKNDNLYLKNLANWELARWYAFKNDYKSYLDKLRLLKKNRKQQDLINRAKQFNIQYQNYLSNREQEQGKLKMLLREFAEEYNFKYELCEKVVGQDHSISENHSIKEHFDIVLVSDFRLVGGSNMSNVEEIKANKWMGKTTGLLQMSRYDFDPERQIISEIYDLIDNEYVKLLNHSDNVTCDVMLIRYPPVLYERQCIVPKIDAKSVHVIINQPPMSDYGPNGVVRYNIEKCQANLVSYFGKKGIWHPIGPLVREALFKYHSSELSLINLSSENWVNIINVEEWKRTSSVNRSNKPIIGRHSRDHEVKWPFDPIELLKIYPDSDEYEVRILGGSNTPRSILGYFPENWTSLEFGDIHPKDFLKELDVFVYYTNPNWVESFGRVIIEAMAAGVPVIVSDEYKELFKDAAIYAKPDEVQGQIENLLNNEQFYKLQVERAQVYVEQNFGYSRHKKRLEDIINGQE